MSDVVDLYFEFTEKGVPSQHAAILVLAHKLSFDKNFWDNFGHEIAVSLKDVIKSTAFEAFNMSADVKADVHDTSPQ